MDDKSQKQAKIITIIVAIIGLGVLGWYLYNKTVPSEDTVKSKAKTIIIVSEDIFTKPVIEEIKSLKQNGTLPIIVTSADRQKTNPFASFK